MAFLYFVSFLLMVTFIFLNLFIAIILQGFSDTNKSENLRISENDFREFQEIWQEFDEDVSSPFPRFLFYQSKICTQCF